MTLRFARRSDATSLHSRRARAEAPRRRTRLGLELLEERWTPAVFNVNTLADGFNIGPGLLSLRQAIQMANATPGGNTINLTVPGTYTQTRIGPNEDANQTGDFDILPSGGDLTIQNTSRGAVAVSGSGTDRVFDINPTPGATPKFLVKMVGFTIEHGFASPGDNGASSGGGIRDQGNASLELDYVTVTDNQATADGGGISMENVTNVPWKLTINNSVISNNHAGDAGGGVEEDGQGTVTVNAGTVITGNTSVNQGAGVWLDAVNNVTANATVTGALIANNIAFTGVGGGVGNSGSGNVVFNASVVEDNFSGAAGGGFGDSGNLGDLTVEAGSFFLNNASTGGGGGIQEGGPLTIIGEATIKGNVTQGDGGGLLLNTGTATAIFDSTITGNVGVNGGGGEDTDGTLNILDASFTNNRALGTADGSGGNGGALDVADGSSAVNIAGTLFQGNFAGNNAVGNGGAINQVAGNLGVTNSEFITNASGNLGGGINFSGMTIQVTNSTFFANHAITGGGALDVQPSRNVANETFSFLVNDTLVANVTIGDGGGLDDQGPGDLFLINDTIAFNAAKNGGGIASTGVGQLALLNTVVADDFFLVPGGAGADVFTGPGSTITDFGGNFVGTLAGSTGFGPTVLTGNPRLGPVQANGGPTVGTLAVHSTILTMAPLNGSPLVAAGVSAGAPSTDERGHSRPTGTKPTIGAYQ